MSVTTIELKHPEQGGITELVMRRPKVRDMLASEKAKGGDADKEITLFANLCEAVPATIEALDMADYQQLQQAYKGFLS